MVSGPASAFASWMAARSVHVKTAVAHAPLPGLASTWFPVLVTGKLMASAEPAARAKPRSSAASRTGATTLGATGSAIEAMRTPPCSNRSKNRAAPKSFIHRGHRSFRPRVVRSSANLK